ncbi:uncharacterized protein MAM_06352 [Metarhizium album ARSEF 1941]|uniref:Uncharacterized protein n=1 Tax=Metarhizium album (strain ARSEF 1941) TaxID=1081103 RepID=A0A0B2WS21_METAS|nr:uncharacterized protein MAM_06352 [Metarhizium album ARSEF 1941]KHN95740.1 hypothetical protein MAM_06352 [Metarhizium album ARSEF 1941]
MEVAEADDTRSWALELPKAKAKKRKKKSVKLPELVAEAADGVDEGVDDSDSRPSSSPYLSKSVRVYFGQNADAFTVPEAILGQRSKLSPARDAWGISASSLDLADVPHELGHVFVHHLFTGTYQCLKPTGPSAHDRRVEELTTSIKVYVAARKYGLHTLVQQAQDEMKRLGKQVPVPTIFRAARDAYPNPSINDTWFIRFLKKRSRALLTDRAAFEKVGFRPGVGGSMSIAEILLESAVESLAAGAAHPAQTSGSTAAEEPQVPAEPLAVTAECVAASDPDCPAVEAYRVPEDFEADGQVREESNGQAPEDDCPASGSKEDGDRVFPETMSIEGEERQCTEGQS